MSLLKRLKPKFWDYQDVVAERRKHLFNYHRMWNMTVFLTAGVALVPLIFFAIVDYHVSRRSIESENLLLTARQVSNARRTVAYFFDERRDALDFVAKEHTFAALNRSGALDQILKNLKISFGGLTDLGLIDPMGTQRAYTGPFNLLGKNYSDQSWFKEVCRRGVFISDVFLGFRNAPHIVIAIKRYLPNGLFYILRATLDTRKFDDLLSGLEMNGKGDAFIINRQGMLQTPSLYHGNVLVQTSLPVPKFAPRTEVFEGTSPDGTRLIIGYRYISATPFILMVVNHKDELMKSWHTTRVELIIFLTMSIIIILGVVAGVATYLVNKIYAADRIRIQTLHQVEYTNKMASIGRLAAGVAHEVNNPLAIINEKAGLIKDLFAYKQGYAGNEKLLDLVDSILSCVKRAGTITKRLLSFSRQAEVSIQPVDLKSLVEEVMGFLIREAEYRSISVSLEVDEGTPLIESDRGKLQEIFLNLVNNAFAAMEDGGHFQIRISPQNRNSVLVTVRDDGCGIPKSDLEHIFEPFFSTRTKKGGTGLGLSLTYNFVQEMGGDISVESEPGKGTTFSVTLPVTVDKKEGKNT